VHSNSGNGELINSYARWIGAGGDEERNRLSFTLLLPAGRSGQASAFENLRHIRRHTGRKWKALRGNALEQWQFMDNVSLTACQGPL